MKTCFGSFLGVLLSFVCFVWSSESIRIEVKDEQPGNNDMLGLRMRVVNNSGLQYNGVQVRYYLKKRATDNFVLENYYLNGLSANLEQVDSTTVVLYVGVPVLGQGYIPDADGISVGVRCQNWEPMHKGDLPNYPGSVFAEPVGYGVYLGDSLIAGMPLSLDSLNGTLKLRFVGIRPETPDSASTWVQLQNYGDTPISLNGVKIKDVAGNSHSLGNLTINAKSTLRVCNGLVSNCASDSVVTSIPAISFGKVGEFVLYQDSVPLDYIAWGARGNFADSLEVESKNIDPEYFFNTSEEPVLGPVSIYRKGDFFRAVIKNGTDSIISWNKFRENMIGLAASQFPYAEPFVLWDGSSVYKRNGEETMLAWVPSAGAKSYKVTVLKAADSSVVYQGYTQRTKLPLQLPAGEYRWLVIPIEADEEGLSRPDYFEPWASDMPSEYHCRFTVYVLPESVEPEVDLHVDPLAARKDSYMLDLKWGEHILDAEWDRPHNSSGYVDQYGNRRFADPKHFYYDAEESWRCWAVATAELNHFYGGNLTQDEIRYHYMAEVKYGENRIFNAFPHGEEGAGFFHLVAPWALNVENVEHFGWTYYPDDSDNYFAFSGMRMTDNEILAALKMGYPVMIWEGTHIMLVDAAIKASGAPYGYEGEEGYIYRFHNIDNDGTVSWRPIWPRTTEAYYIFRNPREINRTVKMSELYTDTNGNGIVDFDEVFDADKDGLIDFDEYYRFATYHENLDYDANGNEKLDFGEYRQFAVAQEELNRDYDQDGIWDKTEIMSYTIREKHPEGAFGVSKEVFADIDGDGFRAEKDPNSDGDGKLDGEEDVNHNGLKDDNETDVFIKDDNQIVVTSDIANVTLYALSELNYNDGVVCYNGEMPTGFCSVASAAQEISDEDYSVKVGARATVGDIYSKGRVLLRSNTRVRGEIILAGSSNVSDIYMQNGSTIDNGILNVPLATWNAHFLPQNYDLDGYSVSAKPNLIVRNGETGTLNPGYYSSVKVEAGGLLYIPPGVTYIGSIQLDPRSNVMFTTPGYETVMNIDGNFTWRAKTLNDETQYPDIARGFKLVQHANGTMFIGNMAAGRIVAPYSHVISAQSRKLFYGTIFAKKISVHQYAKIYHVDFNPFQTLILSMGAI